MGEMLTCAILPLLGIVVGWFANHWLSSARDRRARRYALEDARDARKRDFLSFMSGFRSEAERTYPTQFVELFQLRVHRLREEVAKVRSDLKGDIQARFDEAVTILCRFNDREVSEVAANNDYRGRTRVTEAIDVIVKFVA